MVTTWLSDDSSWIALWQSLFYVTFKTQNTIPHVDGNYSDIETATVTGVTMVTTLVNTLPW